MLPLLWRRIYYLNPWKGEYEENTCKENAVIVVIRKTGLLFVILLHVSDRTYDNIQCRMRLNKLHGHVFTASVGSKRIQESSFACLIFLFYFFTLFSFVIRIHNLGYMFYLIIFSRFLFTLQLAIHLSKLLPEMISTLFKIRVTSKS